MTSSALMNLKRWQIDACGVVLCAALGVAVWMLGVTPLQQRGEEATVRREALSEQTRQAKQLAARMRQLAAQLATARGALAEMRLDLQPASRLNQRLAEVTATAGQCGLQISDVRPGRAVPGKRHTVQPIELSGNGSYPAVARFVRQIHERYDDSGVTSFELASNPADPATPPSFHVRLHWYVAPETASAQ